MAVDSRVLTRPTTPQVLCTDAAGIRRDDQVAFTSAEGEPSEDVAGGVTGVRHSPDRSSVTLIVDNRVHFLPADHEVIIIRGLPPTVGV